VWGAGLTRRWRADVGGRRCARIGSDDAKRHCEGGFRVQGSGCRVRGSGFRVQGSCAARESAPTTRRDTAREGLLLTKSIKEVSPFLPHPCHFQDYDECMSQLSSGSWGCSPKMCADEVRRQALRAREGRHGVRTDTACEGARVKGGTACECGSALTTQTGTAHGFRKSTPPTKSST